MLTMMLASLNERRREMAILRAIGARPIHIVAMFLIEALIIAILGCFLGLVLLYAGMAILQPVVETQLGLFIPIDALQLREWLILSLVMASAAIASIIPAVFAYRHNLADGITVRI